MGSHLTSLRQLTVLPCCRDGACTHGQLCVWPGANADIWVRVGGCCIPHCEVIAAEVRAALEALMWLSCRYVIVYFTLLNFRKQKGVVTKEMLEVPKKQFLGIGLIEALSSITGFISAAKLPGEESCLQSAGDLLHVLFGLAMRSPCLCP